MENGNEIKTINFNGEEYDITDLTPRAVEALNVLFKGQQNLNSLAMDVKLAQAANANITAELSAILEEDKIKPNVKIEKQ
mgnify:CR=1 FL=1|tara:strand:+ start:41 stop:280 length:240 start_codon:yes stop_codon:yes gene_type:complete